MLSVCITVLAHDASFVSKCSTVSYPSLGVISTEQISKDSVMGRTASYSTVEDLVFMTPFDVSK